MFGDVSPLCDQLKNRKPGQPGRVKPRLQSLGQHPGDILVEPAAGDVGRAVEVDSRFQQGQNGFDIDFCGGQQNLTQTFPLQLDRKSVV